MSMNQRQLFLQHVAQTSPSPVGIEIAGADRCYLVDASGKKYLDLIGGISVCNLGHGNTKVIAAIQEQASKYLHVMVYGELMQTPQTQYATALAAHLPTSLNCIYFTNSGSEATEGALKLARRATGRTDVVCCNNSYHGHTMGALSVMGDEYWRNAFRPLLPGVRHFDYNGSELIDAINYETACVLLETIQAEAGVIEPQQKWLEAVRQKCNETGTLLIFDEIQCGFGRTGKLWGFDHFGVIPDIVLLGKALGAGMPMGAFVASHTLMNLFTENPVLGHITTFGGHPVCCAAGLAGFNYLLDSGLVEQVTGKEQLFHSMLQHRAIKAVRSKGLLMAVELNEGWVVADVLKKCLDAGLFSDWFLFAPNCIRLAPPLIITLDEIEFACATLIKCLEGA